MSQVEQNVRRSAIAGVRGSIALSVASLPLSFATNMILGRVSPEALGYYSAVQVCLGSYFTFLVFGGVFVFTRLMPGIAVRDRISFLATYALLVAGLSSTALAVLFIAFPGPAASLSAAFGDPPRALVATVLASGLVWGFASYFLFSTLAAVRATAVDKSAVVGFFVAAALGCWPWRDRLASDPAGYLWLAAAIIYLAGAVLGVALVLRTQEWRERARLRFLLPSGFGSTVAYTHMDTLVNYLYSTLSPAIVLLWLDIGSLGRLHAAMRYVLLVSLIPGTVSSVLAPAVSRLDVSGLRESALRQARAAMRAASLGVVPAVIVLALFAEDAMALFGSEFRSDGDLLRLAALSLSASSTVHVGAGLAAGLGAFRSYLAASAAYAAAVMALTLVLVPAFGLRGAAAALSLGAAVRQAAILVVLRRGLRFEGPGRLAASWGCPLAAVALAWGGRLDRLSAAAAATALIGAYFLWARVDRQEIAALRDKVIRGA